MVSGSVGGHVPLYRAGGWFWRNSAFGCLGSFQSTPRKILNLKFIGGESKNEAKYRKAELTGWAAFRASLGSLFLGVFLGRACASKASCVAHCPCECSHGSVFLIVISSSVP